MARHDGESSYQQKGPHIFCVILLFLNVPSPGAAISLFLVASRYQKKKNFFFLPWIRNIHIYQIKFELWPFQKCFLKDLYIFFSLLCSWIMLLAERFRIALNASILKSSARDKETRGRTTTSFVGLLNIDIKLFSNNSIAPNRSEYVPAER